MINVLCGHFVFAQIENVLIETYYITDANDATDTFGGSIEEGSKTYRIFIDMLPNTKLLAMYGEVDHPLVFTSTAPFFNHKEDGISYGKDFSRSRYENGTVPLDTYITLGQCSKSFGQGAYFGIPKEQDTDGSIIGGVNNDGGSAEVVGGLLTNSVAELGRPLTDADGLTIGSSLPTSWIEIGFENVETTTDTTIFGSVDSKFVYNSTNALLRNSGVTGVNIERNEVLVAQLTTKGDLTFEINLELEILVEGVPQIVNYVARNESLGLHDVYLPLLNYPYACGCTDPNYLEASTTFACTDNSKCLTPVVLGCMDSLACNFDPGANFNIQEVCCYIGYCNDLDLSLVCPDLRQREDEILANFSIYPNPSYNDLYLSLDFVINNEIRYTIADMYGKEAQYGKVNGVEKNVDIKSLPAGQYVLKLETSKGVLFRSFVKL